MKKVHFSLSNGFTKLISNWGQEQDFTISLCCNAGGGPTDQPAGCPACKPTGRPAPSICELVYFPNKVRSCENEIIKGLVVWVLITMGPPIGWFNLWNFIQWVLTPLRWRIKVTETFYSSLGIITEIPLNGTPEQAR